MDSILSRGGTRVLQKAPIIPMRIAAINGIPAARLAPTAYGGEEPDSAGGGEDGTEREGNGPPGDADAPEGWAVRREYRSTYRDTLVDSEVVLRGRMWAPGQGGAGRDGLAQVSMDISVAEDLKVDVGDVVTWDVQGVRIRTRVTSIREVDWQRLEPNSLPCSPARC